MSEGVRKATDHHNGQAVGDADLTVPTMVATQAALTPEAAAVVMGYWTLTYGELDERAHSIARHLRRLGAGPGTVVGCCLERSPDLVVALLGILKAGAAYLPLDPSYPPDRLAFMLRDSESPVVLAHQPSRQRLPAESIQVLFIDEDTETPSPNGDRSLEPAIASEDIAYVIYTSGSTGRPKGVQITHRSLANLCDWHREAFRITARDRGTQVASPSFDATVWELWPYLTAGASVHVPEDAIRKTPPKLRDWLVEQGITVSFLPTPVAEAVMALEWPAQTELRLMLTGGDVLHRRPLSGLPFTLVNNYGPTEGTVVTTSGVVAPGEELGLPSIGRPIKNVSVRVLDEQLRPVSRGEPGELFIRGAGLALGYLKRPDLTAERFVVDGEGQRLYRSGDLVRERTDGELDFLGRVDDQVKIMGFRIELDEIAATLNRHPAVAASAVIARADGEDLKRLIAYIVAVPGDPLDSDALLAYLAGQLPDYMVPAVIVELSDLPLTANGKVDRDALPDPDTVRPRADSLTLPRTPMEKALGEMVCELLGLEYVGVEENFFILGGHSLLGAQLIMLIRDKFGVELSLRQLFENPTVESIALAVEGSLIAEVSALSDEEAARRLATLAGGHG